MKLFYSLTSPYARKVRVTAYEKGLADRIELVPCNPHEPDPALLAANPLGRVPTLVIEDGTALFDSPVICEWLDSWGAGPRLLPPAGDERWRVLRGQALADGMLDDAVAMVLERRRPEALQSPAHQAGRSAALLRAAADVEAGLVGTDGDLSLAHIALGCALAYLDFRLPELDWRPEAPRTAQWLEAFCRRPSMRDTQPQPPPA